MKQVVFLGLMLFGGAVGALVHPFFGIVPYYMLSIVRPQSLWDYALPEGVRWSLIAAGVALFGAVANGTFLFQRLKFNPVAILMAILGVLIVFSCLAAHDVGVASERGIEYFKIFFMALLTTAVIHRFAHLRWLTWVVLACTFYVAWEFNARYLFDQRADIALRGHGGLDNNDTGVMLAMGVPLCYFWWRGRPNVWTAVTAGFAALILIHALMLSYSRSGMVAGLAGLVWLALHHRPRRHHLVIAPLALVAISYMAGPEIRAEFFSIGTYKEDTTAQMRIESWSRGWETAWDHPLSGAGVRNSNLMSAAYGDEQNGRSVHNIYLQIAADSGVPAMIIYLALITTAVFLLWSFRNRLGRKVRIAAIHGRNDLQTEDLEEKRALALSLEASIVAFAAGGVFLSLEFFELPWLILVMAGALPVVWQAEAEAETDASDASAEIDTMDTDPKHPRLVGGPTV